MVGLIGPLLAFKCRHQPHFCLFNDFSARDSNSIVFRSLRTKVIHQY